MGALTYRNPRVVALVLMVLLAAGLSSLISIGRQEDPTITNIFASVTTPFPGAEPGRVEALVTAEIEESLREIAEIDVISSASAAGISVIQVELDETVDPDLIDGLWTEIRDKLADAELRFPDGVGSPELEVDANSGAYGAIVALVPARDGSTPLTLTARYAEALADRLRDVPGTKLVEIFGAPAEEITVTLDAPRAASLGLAPAEVAAAVRSADSKVAAGQLTGGGDDLSVEVEGEIDTLSRLGEIVLREGEGGSALRLADIARIERGPRAPAPELAFQDGLPAVIVAAMPETGLQVDAWAGFVREDLAAFQDGLPGGLEARLVFDQSTYTAERLTEVGTNMGVGVALVVGVLLVTLGLRAAIMVALILPIVSLASLATMNAIGLPIHQMSVTGLIVALGLLVDAGIVMTDDIGRRLRAGAARAEAVAASTRRLAMPLFASTATTALSFVPMILLPGPAGDFVGSIALAVVIMLCWSFVVAITITPAVAGWLLPEGAKGGGLPSGPLGRLFRASLRLSARSPIRSIALAMVLPVLGFLSLPMLTAQFFPGVDRDQFTIDVDLPPGSGIERTAEVVRRLDAALDAREEIESVTWTVGRSAPPFYYNIVGGRDGAPRHAQALIRTASAQATEAVLPDLQRGLPALAPEAQVLVRGLVQGPPVAAPVEFRIIGPELEVLRADPARVRDMAILPPGAAALAGEGGFAATPLSALAEVRVVPGDGIVTRRDGERMNTVQGFVLRGVLPSEALAEVRAAMDEAGFTLPPGYRLEMGGDSDARASTLNNLIAPLGLIVTLSVAVVVMTFGSFRLGGVALVVAGLSAGLSMLALAVFDYPFGINAIIGLIGSIGVSINAALIIMTALQDDEAASAGDPDAMAEVVMASSRHIVSTTITTVGGFLPLILAGGGFWPPFAMAVAGGVALSTVVSFYFTPPAFRLVYAREPGRPTRAEAARPAVLRLRSEDMIAAE
jgi:multidrug efflux pump subunit AcrB